MSYNTIVVMANDGDLQQRFTACAAQEGQTNPDMWASSNRWILVSSDQQAINDYMYAIETDNDGVGNYGKRSDVVSDAKILAMVQALRAKEATL